MCAKFVDASVFVHAFLKPKRALKPHERALKRKARDIVSRINRGEEVCTSVVHMAEIANILEDWMSLEDSRSVLVGLCMRDTVTILQVNKEQLIEAVSVGQVIPLGTTDALAVILMEANSIAEIYSFDKDFDGVEGIHRVAE